MIIVIGGTKGGCGKSTIATNFCVMRSETNKKILLVDADEQATSFKWCSQRQALGLPTSWTAIQLSGKSVHSEVKKLSNNYDDIIIDVGGRDTTSQRSALIIADVCLIPFQPSSFDIWEIGELKAMIEEIKTVNNKLKVFLVLSRADPSGPDNDEATEILEELTEYTFIPTLLVNRKIYRRASSNGMGIVEIKKVDVKAVEEIRSVYSYIFDMQNMS